MRTCTRSVLVVVALLVLAGLSIALGACAQPGSDESETGGTPAQDYADATYVGSERCAECHDRVYAKWLGTNHSRVIQSVEENPLAIIGDFTQPFPDSVTDPFSAEDVVYIHGVQWKQRYIDADWHVRPAQWNIDTEAWAPYEAEEWQERDWRTLCAYCHTVGYDIETNEWNELSVGCEACHGPGSAHSDNPRIDNIMNPAQMTPRLAADVCGQCHNRGKSPDGEWDFPVGYVPGTALNPENFTPVSFENTAAWWPNGTARMHRQQYIEWKGTDHFLAGVGCIDCHTVHTADRKFATRSVPNTLCRQCHDVSTDPITGHAPLFGAPEHSDCVGCHMPNVAKSADFGDEATHSFRVIEPSVTIELGDGDVEKQPNSCSLCHPNAPLEALQQSIDQGKARLRE